jgi:hypothetical protein
MMPINRLAPTAAAGLTALLLRNEVGVSSNGSDLAWAQSHLGTGRSSAWT